MAWARRLTSVAAVLAQRVDRPAREVVVEEEPRDALAVVVPVVVHHGEQARQPLDDEAVLDEQGGDLLAGARRGHGGGELVLADHRADCGTR